MKIIVGQWAYLKHLLKKNVEGKSPEITRSYRRCINGHIYDPTIYGEQCPFCPNSNKNDHYYPVDSSNDFEDCTCIRHLESNGIENQKTNSFESGVNNIEKENSQSAHSSLDKISRYITSIIRFHESQPYDHIYSSIFAPAEVKLKSHMLVQVYLHLHEETEKVKTLAQESDKDAERRDYIPLQCKFKRGDKVDVVLNIYGETLLMSAKKSVIWQGAFTKCIEGYWHRRIELCGITIGQWSTCWLNAVYYKDC